MIDPPRETPPESSPSTRPEVERLPLAALPYPVLVVDGEDVVVGANRRAEALFNRSREELVGGGAGRLFADGFFLPLDRQRARAASEIPNPVDLPARTVRVVRPDGSTTLCEGTLTAVPAPGTSTGWLYVGVFIDVGSRLRAEQALRRREASFRAVVEALVEGVGVHREGRFVYANPALAALLGAAGPEALLGRRWPDVVHPEDRAVIDEQLALRAKGTAGPPREVRLLRLDGGPVWAEAASARVEHDGEPAWALVVRDVGERRRMQVALLQADRLLSVGTLAAGVAHEINNPLTYVITNLGFVCSELERIGEWLGPVPESAAPRLADALDALAEAREGADRVRVIARDLKTFSRSDEGRRERVQVVEVLESTLNMARNEIRHRARVVRDFRPVPLVEGNPARLGQVFLNLLVNAAQAIPEGAVDQNEIRLVVRGDAHRVVVEVHDTGVGVPPEARGRLFDPFYTTKPAGVGTGLGLAVCASIVHGLGGTIDLVPEVERGAAFRVVLPAVAELVEEERTSPGEAIPAAVRGRVLIIDDEPAVGNAAARALREEHDVVALTRPREALRRIVDGESFDLVLCDVMMPDMTGMDVYAALERLAPGILPRVVFLTGGAFTPRAMAFLDSVPNARMDKPFEEEALRRFVRHRVSTG